MLSLGNGLCIGSNNGCIGGSSDWSVQDLNTQLTWPEGGGNPTIEIEPNAPDCVKKRFVYYRAVTTAAASFPSSRTRKSRFFSCFK